MSKLAADNLRAKAAGVETPMVYPVRGSAKAWANVFGTGATGIRSSLNVSSIVDAAVGYINVNLTNAMASTSYAVLASCSDLNWGSKVVVYVTSASQYGTATFQGALDSGSAGDADVVCVDAKGTLA